MDTILYKYHCLGDDYLVYDTCRNHIALDARAIRTICARNFGLGSVGILVGPMMDGAQMTMKSYRPDGSEMTAGLSGTQTFCKYLRDAGYLGDHACILRCDSCELSLSGEPEASDAEEIGKLFLSEAFIDRNHIARCEQTC